MAQQTIAVQCNSVRTRAVATLAREVGRIRSASATPSATTAEPMQTFARLSMVVGGTDESNIVMVLAQGYIGGRSGISWTGDLPLGGGMSVMLEAWSSVSDRVIMSTITDTPT